MSGTIRIHVPMRLAIRGGRKTIVSEVRSQETQPRVENALLKALAKAHRWRCQIENGEYSSVAELARTYRLNESYACRLLRLTLLAPSIVADILDGKQTGDLTLKKLKKPLPVRWDEQLVAFGVLDWTTNA